MVNFAVSLACKNDMSVEKKVVLYGDRQLVDQEVGGSIPPASTSLFNKLQGYPKIEAS